MGDLEKSGLENNMGVIIDHMSCNAVTERSNMILGCIKGQYQEVVESQLDSAFSFGESSKNSHKNDPGAGKQALHYTG